jgi:NAD+ diphosphatase
MRAPSAPEGSSEPLAPRAIRAAHSRFPLFLHAFAKLRCASYGRVVMSFTPAVVPPDGATPRVWLLIHKHGLIVREDERGVSLPTDDDLAALSVTADDAHYLGVLHGEHLFAAKVEGKPTAGLVARHLMMLHGTLADDIMAVAGRASHVIDWASTHRFCGRCGAENERDPSGERAMRCPRCGLLAYPRITPAIIVLVRRGEQALLARGARFPLPFYSTLAGFSEIGESLEETLAREVREEVGIEVKNVRYFGSQPWPFPNSLMLGFVADYAGGEIVIDPKEIVDAGWYSVDALPSIPPPVSIARRLIDAWIADVRGTPP